MLILTRNCGEAIHIGPNVQIRILGISGNQVRIGVAAPADVAIFRSELVNIPDVAAKLRAGGAVDMVVAEESTDA